MKVPHKVQIVLTITCSLLACQVSGDADPEAEAAPDPDPVAKAEPRGEANPDPIANPQRRYNWGYPSSNLNYPSQAMVQQMSTCAMTQQCCGMERRNCCFRSGEQRCYSIYERKCEREDLPECQLKVDRHCHDVRVRDCRVITEVEYRNFPVLACFPKPMTECFEYTKKICSPTVEPEVHTVTWINQRLVPISEKEESHCFDQRTVNCTTKEYEEQVTEQEERQKNVLSTKKKCSMVQKKSEDREVLVPVTRIIYKTSCNRACTPSSGCQATSELVPQRVTDQVRQLMPGTVTWKEKCEDVPYDRTEVYFVPVTKTVKRTKEVCKPLVQPHCHNYTVPEYGVANETKFDKITVSLPGCHQTMIKDRFCHTFPTGDLTCRNSTAKKAFKLNKVVCDQIVTKPECFNIPVADCRIGSANKCKMVERKVCNNDCVDSVYCQQCNAFRNGPGFGSCKTSTCGTYYPRDEDMMSNTWQSESGVVGANDSEYEQRYIVEASERDVYNLGPNENFGASGIGRRTSVQEQLDESLKV